MRWRMLIVTRDTSIERSPDIQTRSPSAPRCFRPAQKTSEHLTLLLGVTPDLETQRLPSPDKRAPLLSGRNIGIKPALGIGRVWMSQSEFRAKSRWIPAALTALT